jgi:hypothetical protein
VIGNAVTHEMRNEGGRQGDSQNCSGRARLRK